jgi:hypothetical protein
MQRAENRKFDGLRQEIDYQIAHAHCETGSPVPNFIEIATHDCIRDRLQRHKGQKAGHSELD